MAKIVDKTYFNKPNALYIPLAIEVPIPNPITSSPNESGYLDALCIDIEKTILVNALGLDTYNELQLALEDIDNPLYASYKKLVQGDEYNGKLWVGLQHDLSLIAQAVWIEFVSQKTTNLSAVGNAQVNVEKGTLVTPLYKIANASSSFIKQYQGNVSNEPIVNGNFIDWIGYDNEIEVSLYRYLIDKKADFPNLDLNKFRFYEQLNSFGI